MKLFPEALCPRLVNYDVKCQTIQGSADTFYLERVETTSMDNVSTEYIKWLFQSKTIWQELWLAKLGWFMKTWTVRNHKKIPSATPNLNTNCYLKT